jgi:hypothetical protein
VGGLAESNPAVLGDRRWFSGEEICSAVRLGSKRCARRRNKQIKVFIFEAVRFLRECCASFARSLDEYARILRPFAYCYGSFPQDSLLAIRDSSLLRSADDRRRGTAPSRCGEYAQAAAILLVHVQSAWRGRNMKLNGHLIGRGHPSSCSELSRHSKRS